MGKERDIKHTTGSDAIYTLIFDARGNGNGYISPTITGGHQSNISDYTAIVVEKHTYRKTTHPKRGDGQGWEPAAVADTLNAFDNGETRTPILIVELKENEKNT